MSRTVDSEISNFKSGSVPTGYKHTEVGVIPEEWEAAHIGDVCSFAGGSQPPRSTFRFTPTPGYIRLIQIRDYKSDDFASYIPEALARKRCTSEDIMIGRYGPPVFQILRGLAGAYNVALIKTTLSQKVDREFFFNVLSQDPLFQLIDALSRRSSGQTGVEMPALKTYGLPLPPLAEQRVIATALSDVDGLLGGLDRLIAKRRELKQAAMQQLLTGQTRLPGFKEKWEVKLLGAICKLINGRGFKPHEWSDVGLPIIRIQNLNGSEEFNYYSGPYDPKLEVEYGQLLFAWSGSRGTSFGPHVWKGGRALLNYHTWKVVVDTAQVQPKYFFHALRQLTIAIEDQAHGASALVHTQKGEMERLSVPVPSSAEQSAIAEVLTDMDAELAALEQRRNKTRDLKQAMMQELLTGKTRLV